MLRLRLSAAFFMLMLLSAVSAAQDIVEGDLPVGQPFDGTSDRASMFDLYQVANATLSILAEIEPKPDVLPLTHLKQALSARGYPVQQIVLLPNTEAIDTSCSKDGLVEVRVSRNLDRRQWRVVVASQYWFSEGKSAAGFSDDDPQFAQNCSAEAE